MRRTLILLQLAVAMVASAAFGGEDVKAVLRVAELLGPDTWARPILIENTDPRRGSRYPARFPALVFALQGMLWMYTPLDGTQSISQYRGRLEYDQSNLGPLLEAVEPGLKRFVEIIPAAAEFAMDGPVPFACLPRCVARWRELMTEASPPDDARLLNYYLPARSGQKGHTVLEYRRGDRRYIFDPDRPTEVHEVAANAEDALEVVRAVALQRAVRPPTKVMALALGQAGLQIDDPRIAVRREPGAGSNRSAFMR